MTYVSYENGLPEHFTEEQLKHYFDTEEGLAEQKAQGTTYETWLEEMIHMQILIPESEQEPIMESIIYKHGQNDYSVWQLDIPEEAIMEIENILDKYRHRGCSVRGTVDDLAKEFAIKEERNKVLDELVNEMKNNYFHMIGAQFDNAILEMEKIAEKLKR